MARGKVIERRMTRFLREPVSVRNAAGLITLSTALVVVGSGVLMRLLDRDEYPNIGRGLWWAMQTVTTVGYGDVTPEHPAGRIVAAVVMLWGIAFVSILVAAITSTFVTRAEREHDQAQQPDEETAQEEVLARFDDLSARLERLEQTLTRVANR